MQFKRRRSDEPEVNIIPLIDVLMAILIFLMLTTTFHKFTELQLQLPTANAEAARDYPKEVVVAISSEGRYAVNKQPLDTHSTDDLTEALRALGPSPETVLIISADAATPHQAVVSAIEAARRMGMQKVTFATRKAE
ncbi:MAG: biopolymer transporter ExbD [Brachymonas sp.]|nr:biopolymer transporter ExbD [Brachymonas sp.]